MIRRALAPTTVVPESLYVERSADRQVDQILQTLGRPGYILVARQMGKTNLLFHAKRRFDSPQNLMIYADLSNTYEDPRLCYRSIIDVAIEARPDLFPAPEILLSRERTNSLPPHKEHERELRHLLTRLPGRLVIAFDEIDALSKTGFSDQFFAQVRSVYFARINFPEYARLGHILSGVAEPSDLIKDKRLSPFNIGEKIYLDDFEMDEFTEFVRRAQLYLSRAVISRVYWWCSGNPRMSWDICAQLEDLLVERRHVDADVVDAIVQSLYFGDTQHAPIDHMRAIVESRAEIRDAVVQVRHGRGSDLDDKIKTELYLAGIVSSSFVKETLSLKSRIVSEALSDRWLTHVAARSGNAIEQAQTLIEARDYAGADRIYRDFFDSSSFSDLKIEGKGLVLLSIAETWFAHAEFARALVVYERAQTTDLLSERTKAEITYRIGLCTFRLGRFEESIAAFESVRQNPAAGSFRILAEINRFTAFIQAGVGVDYHEMVTGLRQSLNSLETLRAELGPIELQRVRVQARYNLGRALQASGDAEGAKIELRAASDAAEIPDRPKILLALLECEATTSARAEVLVQIRDTITQERLHLSDRTASAPLAFDSETLLDLISEAFDPGSEAFNDILQFAARSLNEGAMSEAEVVLQVALRRLGSRDIGRAGMLFRSVLDATGGVGLAGRQALEYLVVGYFNETDERTQRLFFDPVLNGHEARPLDMNLLRAFVQRLSLLLRDQRYADMFEISRFVDKHRESCAEKVRRELLLLDFFGVQASVGCGEFGDARIRAERLLEEVRAARPRIQDYEFVNAEGLALIQRGLMTVIQAAQPPRSTPRRDHTNPSGSTIVRVKLRNGQIIRAKFKKVEADVMAGRAVLLPDDDLLK